MQTESNFPAWLVPIAWHDLSSHISELAVSGRYRRAPSVSDTLTIRRGTLSVVFRSFYFAGNQASVLPYQFLVNLTRWRISIRHRAWEGTSSPETNHFVGGGSHVPLP